MKSKSSSNVHYLPGSQKRASASNPLQQAEEAIENQRELFNIDFGKITRLKGDVANGDGSDAVVYEAEAELAMRRLITHFGFDRLPLTWAEMNGVLDYCENIWIAAGGGIPAASVKDWRKSYREVMENRRPWRIPALDAYVAGDLERLRQVHLQEKTLERVAAEWREFRYEPGHPLYGIEEAAE
jgi:hypothetical protein